MVGETTDGQAAVRFVAEHPTGIVLMDLQMPVVGGLEATRLIKNRWPEVNAIVLTIDVAQQAEALAAGADTLIIK